MTRPHARRAVENLPAYVPGARPAVGAQAFKLSSNENPYPPLPSVVAAVGDAAVDLNRYPSMLADDLATALAGVLDVEPAQVVPTAGSIGALTHLLTAFCEPGDEVVLPWRSFEAYPIVTTLAGAVEVRVPLTADGRLDLAGLADAVTPRTKAVMVCTPNNPTGPAVHTDELDQLLAAVGEDVLVVVDEAYAEFVRDPQAVDGLTVLAEHPNVVVLRTFSKAYGLAGLRVGYAVARPRIAAAIRKAVTPFEVSGVAERAAILSLRVAEELTDRVERLVVERGRLLGGLRAAGWTVPDSQANFVWLPCGERTTAVAEACARAGVLVRPFAPEGVRISVGEREATDLVLDVVAGGPGSL